MARKPPVLVVLGHIDHGKSTLIDCIRKANVAAKEAGGITQSIGAYQVALPKGKSLTVIDTPGHEAFETMRAHGAKAADIAILVVAADEGVKPQTIEAIRAIKDAKLPFVVAINKMDAPGANPQKVKKNLAQHEVYVEGSGGDVPVAEISAKTGKGVKELLDLVMLVAEVEELRAEASASARGVVIASSRDAKKGGAATLIVKEGTLKEGAFIRLKSTYGKIRAMHNFEGKRVKEAGPSVPVHVLGLEDLPDPGEPFEEVSSLKQAREGKEAARETREIKDSGEANHVIKLILKAKEKASLNALERMIVQARTAHPDTHIAVIAASVGDIALSDIELAHRFKAFILAFQVKTLTALAPLAQQRSVVIKSFPLIHDVVTILEEIALQTRAPQETTPEKAEVAILGVFAKDKKGQVIGGKVQKGTLRRGALFTISRNGSMIGKGKVINLQHLKKDVTALPQGKECGILFEADAQVQVNDTLVEV